MSARVGAAADPQVPLYGLFEVALTNDTPYQNPFADVELDATFTSPSQRLVSLPGFHDGDGQGGQDGNVWKQRFMPDEIGRWHYAIQFDDGSPGASGWLDCVAEAARPGPWRQDPSNPRWFTDSTGKRFLPIAFHANAMFTPGDWRDALVWAADRGFNTIVTGTMNDKFWGAGWPNVTPFVAVDPVARLVDYDRFDIRVWREWDAMLTEAGDAGIYIAPFTGPAGDYGGQSGEGTVVPPNGLEYGPTLLERFDTAHNLRLIRYYVARQAAYWNLAYWNLYSTEIFEIKSKQEVIEYGEHFASITPFGRMITAQDIEQDGRTWLSEMAFASSRKLNTVQGAAQVAWVLFQEAGPNNAFMRSAYQGYPVFATETLWEGQSRALEPLRNIWGAITAGSHMMWADWSYDQGVASHKWGSIGRGWLPVYAMDVGFFGDQELGADTVGDEYLPIALQILRRLAYWRMNPDNSVVGGGSEAYALVEAGEQYLIYAPHGGEVRLDLSAATGSFGARWFDPKTGLPLPPIELEAGGVSSFDAPDDSDWVLLVQRGGAPVPFLFPVASMLLVASIVGVGLGGRRGREQMVQSS